MSTTKSDLVTGLKTVRREGDRVMSKFGADDWKKKALDADEEGWSRKQVYCHLSALAEVTPMFIGNLAKAADGTDGAAGMDINAMNAQLVASKEQLGEKELHESFNTNFDKLIEFVQGMPDEQLAGPRKFGLVDGSLAEVMDSILVLHPMAHIYGAGGSPLG